MEVIYRNNFWDLVWFNFYQYPRARTNQVIFILFLVVVGYSAVDVLNHTDLSLAEKITVSVMALIAFLLAIAIISFINLILLQLFSSHQRLLISHDSKLSLSETGIVSESGIGRNEIKWSGITKIHQNKGYILVFLSDQAAFIVPKRSFTNTAEADKFSTYLRARWENAKNTPTPK